MGVPTTDVKDRVYFKSIYLHDPDGHVIELATAGPGWTHDESPDALGTTLQLPPWLEAQRESIASNLSPLRVPAPAR
jgi:glyoxalase family protein